MNKSVLLACLLAPCALFLAWVLPLSASQAWLGVATLASGLLFAGAVTHERARRAKLAPARVRARD